jgi:hypothetical protein
VFAKSVAQIQLGDCDRAREGERERETMKIRACFYKNLFVLELIVSVLSIKTEEVSVGIKKKRKKQKKKDRKKGKKLVEEEVKKGNVSSRNSIEREREREWNQANFAFGSK